MKRYAQVCILLAGFVLPGCVDDSTGVNAILNRDCTMQSECHVNSDCGSETELCIRCRCIDPEVD